MCVYTMTYDTLTGMPSYPIILVLNAGQSIDRYKMWKASPAAVNATAAVATSELEKILKVFNLIKNTDTKLIKVRTFVRVYVMHDARVCVV